MMDNGALKRNARTMWSAVECRTLNRESLGSNPIFCFEAWTYSFSPRRPDSLSCIDEYLTIDSVENAIE